MHFFTSWKYMMNLQMFQGENVTDLGDGKIEHLWEFGYADRVFRKIELRTNKINNDIK